MLQWDAHRDSPHRIILGGGAVGAGEAIGIEEIYYFLFPIGPVTWPVGGPTVGETTTTRLAVTTRSIAAYVQGRVAILATTSATLAVIPLAYTIAASCGRTLAAILLAAHAAFVTVTIVITAIGKWNRVGKLDCAIDFAPSAIHFTPSSIDLVNTTVAAQRMTTVALPDPRIGMTREVELVGDVASTPTKCDCKNR